MDKIGSVSLVEALITLDHEDGCLSVVSSEDFFIKVPADQKRIDRYFSRGSCTRFLDNFSCLFVTMIPGRASVI